MINFIFGCIVGAIAVIVLLAVIRMAIRDMEKKWDDES